MAEGTVASVSFICKQCGVRFERQARKDIRTPRYCSRQCCARSYAGRLGPPPILSEIMCQFCYGIFLPTTCRQKFCSYVCRRSWHNRSYCFLRNPAEGSCKCCGATFVRERRRHSWICPLCVVENVRLARNNASKRRKAIKRASHAITAERFTDEAIFARDKWRCQHCKKTVHPEYDVNHDRYPNLDHIVPLAMGGPHTRANVQLLCRACNMIKGATLASGTQLRLLG